MNREQTESLEKVVLPEGRGYDVHFRSVDDIPQLLDSIDISRKRCVIVSDSNVAPIYIGRLSDGLGNSGYEILKIVLPAGEATKSQTSLQTIYDKCLAWGINRKTPMFALGGGVIGDVSGFAAATLLRGIPLIHIPTSLIAQVDSAIGGKTGLNHAYGKNLIGSFYQPLLVCADHELLFTLPDREWSSGLAEVFKHALVADVNFFEWIEQHLQEIIGRDRNISATLVQRAAAIKCRIVSEDELESGLRMILNFGHTFGHALERTLRYGTLTHGEAVAVGMRAALTLSSKSGKELERADRVLCSLPVPHVPGSISIEELTSSIANKKKRTTDGLRFVLIDKTRLPGGTWSENSLHIFRCVPCARSDQLHYSASSSFLLPRARSSGETV